LSTGLSYADALLLLGVLLLGIGGSLVSQWVVVVEVSQNAMPKAACGGSSYRTGTQIKSELNRLLRRYQDGKLSDEQFQDLTNELIDELGTALNKLEEVKRYPEQVQFSRGERR
jgi:hypothetical protein